MTLVDTSSWVHLLRETGDPTVGARVATLPRSYDACWCPPVQLELWNGAQGPEEKGVLQDFADGLPILPIDEDVWEMAYAVSRRARSSGVTVGAIDLIVFACARRHGVPLEAEDKHFDALARAIEPVG